MKRLGVSFLFLILTFASILAVGPSRVQGQVPPVPPPAGPPPEPIDGSGPSTEFAVSDACGYSRVTRQDPNDAISMQTSYVIPGGWEACRKCLYPLTTNVDNPDSKETVRIDPLTGRAPTPAIGRYHTAIGCISTTNFRSFGSASGLVQPMLNVLFGVSGGIAFIYIIYGSFTVLTSRAEPEKLNHGKRLIVGSVIGLIFSVSAVFIINFIANNILKIPGFGQ